MAKSSLFSRLLDLHAQYPGRVPGEDFFTELVAYLFESSPAILLGWLESLGWQTPAGGYHRIEVDSQTVYSPLPEQTSASRPDMRVELWAGERRDLVFIESKLGSVEGEGQLKNYAEILDGEPPGGRKWLVYITRQYDPKDDNEIFESIPATPVKFIQLRWRDFYRYLVQQPLDFLVGEICRFMEENGMGKQITFSESDLPTMGNLQHPFQLMLGVLDQDLQRKFQSVVGSRGQFTPLEFLTRDWARFCLEGELVEGGLKCILGFCDLASGAEPKLCLILQVYPEKDYGNRRFVRVELIEMMKDILANWPGWCGYGLDDPREYSLVEKKLSLRELLASGEVEDACRGVLVGFLDEVEGIMGEYTQIDWKHSPGLNT